MRRQIEIETADPRDFGYYVTYIVDDGVELHEVYFKHDEIKKYLYECDPAVYEMCLVESHTDFTDSTGGEAESRKVYDKDIFFTIVDNGLWIQIVNHYINNSQKKRDDLRSINHRSSSTVEATGDGHIQRLGY